MTTTRAMQVFSLPANLLTSLKVNEGLFLGLFSVLATSKSSSKIFPLASVHRQERRLRAASPRVILLPLRHGMVRLGLRMLPKVSVEEGDKAHVQ